MDKFADEAMYNEQKEWEQEQKYQASESAKAEADIKAQEEMEMASDIKKIEEVKNILRKFREQIEEEHYDAQLEAEAKICQLFPSYQDAECQRRVERIFQEIEEHESCDNWGNPTITIGVNNLGNKEYLDWWQVLKKQERI